MMRTAALKPSTKPMKQTGFTQSGILRAASVQLSARKPRKCKICRTPLVNARPGAIVCGPDCATTYVRLQTEKEARRLAKIERMADKRRREALKTRADYLAEAQAAFNAWVRKRDENFPCISCGRFHQGAYDAGHYRSVGSMPALRFHEDNVHKQCVPCNQHRGGNVVEYRIALIARIGAERVAFLEGPHEPAKYTIEDAKAIKSLYRAKLRELQG